MLQIQAHALNETDLTNAMHHHSNAISFGWVPAHSHQFDLLHFLIHSPKCPHMLKILLLEHFAWMSITVSTDKQFFSRALLQKNLSQKSVKIAVKCLAEIRIEIFFF